MLQSLGSLNNITFYLTAEADTAIAFGSRKPIIAYNLAPHFTKIKAPAIYTKPTAILSRLAISKTIVSIRQIRNLALLFCQG
jgi:hypothetical protein